MDNSISSTKMARARPLDPGAVVTDKFLPEEAAHRLPNHPTPIVGQLGRRTFAPSLQQQPKHRQLLPSHPCVQPTQEKTGIRVFALWGTEKATNRLDCVVEVEGNWSDVDVKWRS
jgi:hypothetical protein